VLAFLAARLLLAVVARLRRRYQGSWWPDADHAGTGITAAPALAVRPRQLAGRAAMFMGSSEECCLHATLSSSAAGCGAVLLVAATILFVVGTTIERSQARTGEGQEATTLEQSAGEHNEQAEATQGQANTTEGTEEHGNAGESGEELFGINPESAGPAAAVAAVLLLLAVLPVARPARGCWWPWP